MKRAFDFINPLNYLSIKKSGTYAPDFSVFKLD